MVFRVAVFGIMFGRHNGSSSIVVFSGSIRDQPDAAAIFLNLPLKASHNASRYLNEDKIHRSSGRLPVSGHRRRGRRQRQRTREGTRPSRRATWIRKSVETASSLSMGLTTLVRREIPHITGLLIDGAISVLCPTLVVFKVGALALVKAGDSTLASWGLLIVCDCGVAALTALGGFRSRTFIGWQEGKRQRDETERVTKAQVAEARGERLKQLG